MRDLEQSERELANRTQEVLNAFTHMNGAKAVAETIAKRRIFLGTLPGLGEADKRDQDMLTSNVADLVLLRCRGWAPGEARLFSSRLRSGSSFPFRCSIRISLTQTAC